jgi:hypothetical protein
MSEFKHESFLLVILKYAGPIDHAVWGIGILRFDTGIVGLNPA